MELVPDTSAVVDGRISERVEAGEFAGATVVVPEAVLGELEAQANDGRETGVEGIAELRRLLDLVDDGDLSVEYVGRRPDALEKREAGEGEIDALIRDVADDRGATLVTSDEVQADVARAKDIAVEYLEPRSRSVGDLALAKFFDEETMSVHLKVGARPMAKRGSVEEVVYEPIRDDVSTEAELREYATEVEESARASPDGFVELDEPGMTIVQFRAYRIAIARPPFADGLEITAVRPIARTTIEDYAYADELRERLLDRQRGVLLAGAPGAGKSTLAQAIAEFLQDNAVSVKTMEQPRDLQVGPEITQYAELGGSMAKTADSLLMVRPDYTIYDEVRETDDFEVFADMRLAGVGMIGVVHATRAIDALQRLVGRVELGLIPQVVDTVVYVEGGEITTVYDVRTTVKVPEGLTEEDLARPVIVIEELDTGRPVYEIYSFNRQVVTVPLDEDGGGGGLGGGLGGESGMDKIAREEIEAEIRQIADGHVEVDLTGGDGAIVWVEERDISQVIGKGGGRITDVENRLGVTLDVRTFDERPSGSGGGDAGGSGGGGRGGGGAGGSGGGASGQAATDAGVIVAPEVTSRHVVVPAEDYDGETVEIRADGEYLFTATVSRGGEVQVSRGSAIAEELEQAIDRKQRITVVPT